MPRENSSPALGPPISGSMLTLTWNGKSKPGPGVMPTRVSVPIFLGVTSTVRSLSPRRILKSSGCRPAPPARP